MGYKLPDVFVPTPIAPPGWGTTKSVQAPAITNAEDKKKSFGIELAKGIQPFQAACNICGQDTQQALWISSNWLNDPTVIANKDAYLKGVDTIAKLLDKDQLAAKLLAMAEERNASGTFYILDGKDRLKALELYAKIQKFTDGEDINIRNNFIPQITVKFVEPDKKEIKTIETVDNDPSIVPTKLKLVG